MSLKTGKKPATYDKRDLRLADYLNMPLVPKHFSYQRGPIADWGMLGNDRHGDCVWAGAAHETMLWNHERGTEIPFTAPSVLQDYAAVTGFDPATGANDAGTDVRTALNYRRSKGVLDGNAKRHKIGAYVALEPGNHEHLLAALYLFGAVGIGIEFPESAMDQFDAGKRWSVVHGATVNGGHYIPLVARDSSVMTCVTWAKEQEMTTSFYAKYCDEAYALLSTEMLTSGKGPHGFDLAQLQHDLTLVG